MYLCGCGLNLLQVKQEPTSKLGLKRDVTREGVSKYLKTLGLSGKSLFFSGPCHPPHSLSLEVQIIWHFNTRC